MKRGIAIYLAFTAIVLAQSAESIRPIGTLELASVLHDERALNRAHDVELQGNFAFVAGKGGSLAIVNIADPRRPEIVSFLHDPDGLEDAQTVLPMGEVLLLGTRDLLAVDIRDKAHPKILKKISDRPRIDSINGFALRGKHVLAANKRGFIALFDVSNPANPIHAGSLNTKDSGGPQSPHDVAVNGDHAIVVDTAPNRKTNVYVYRVAGKTHETLPVEQWILEGTVPNRRDQEMEGANRVATWKTYGAAGAFVPDRVGIFNLADPANPLPVSALPVCDIDATGMTISGQILFVAGGECVEAIDVSDPAVPVSLAQYRGGQLFPTRRIMLNGAPRYDNGHDLVYRDGYLYVTAQNDHRLGILKVLDRKILRLAQPQEEGK